MNHERKASRVTYFVPLAKVPLRTPEVGAGIHTRRPLAFVAITVLDVVLALRVGEIDTLDASVLQAAVTGGRALAPDASAPLVFVGLDRRRLLFAADDVRV
jgi:hypothetical protein